MMMWNQIAGPDALMFAQAWDEISAEQHRVEQLLRVRGDTVIEIRASLTTPRSTWVKKFGILSSRHHGIVGWHAVLPAAWFEMLAAYLSVDQQDELTEQERDLARSFCRFYEALLHRRQVWLKPRGYLLTEARNLRRNLPWRAGESGRKAANRRRPRQFEREVKQAAAQWERMRNDANVTGPLLVTMLALSGSIYRAKRRRVSFLAFAIGGFGLFGKTGDAIGLFLVRFARAVWHAFDGGAFWIWLSNGFSFEKRSLKWKR